MNEQTLELINAIESGKSTAIEASFNEIMANKLVVAIDAKRNEIASGLFGVQEDTVEEEVVPGSVKKDKEGNVTRFKTVSDKPKFVQSGNKIPRGMEMTAHGAIVKKSGAK